jgi:hypothetical protein
VKRARAAPVTNTATCWQALHMRVFDERYGLTKLFSKV